MLGQPYTSGSIRIWENNKSRIFASFLRIFSLIGWCYKWDFWNLGEILHPHRCSDNVQNFFRDENCSMQKLSFSKDTKFRKSKKSKIWIFRKIDFRFFFEKYVFSKSFFFTNFFFTNFFLRSRICLYFAFDAFRISSGPCSAQ